MVIPRSDRLGDVVRIAETRPLSREKRWLVVEVVVKGDVAEVAPRDIGARIIEETREAAAAEATAIAPAASVADVVGDEGAEPAAASSPEAEPVVEEAGAEDAAPDADAAPEDGEDTPEEAP